MIDRTLVKKCPDCGGDLVRSETHKDESGYTKYFWRKPFGKVRFTTIKFNSKVYPWACMNCGRVFFYLDEKELEEVKREYEVERIKP